MLRDGESLLNLSYQYTQPGRAGVTGQLTRVTDNLHAHRSIGYDYDALARLRQATCGPAEGPPIWTQRYGYDRYGNRTGVTASGTTPDGTPIPADGISSLEFGRLIFNGLRRSDNRITTPGFAYDEAGNLVRGQLQDGTWQRYRYDTAGRLVAVADDAGAVLETYAYGACRRRVRTRDERTGTDLCHIWHGDFVIAEYYGESVQTPLARSFVHLGDRLLCSYTRTAPGAKPTDGPVEVLRYHHPGRLGTRLITTPGTKDVLELTALPYGTQLLPESPESEAEFFTSYRRSPTTGIDYAVNRFYDSQLGRFLEPDPLGVTGIQIGQPQGNNAYSYVMGDPINLHDPTGLICFDEPHGAVVQPMDFDPSTGTLTESGPRAEYWWTERTCIPVPDPDEFARGSRSPRDDRRRGIDQDNRGAELARALFTGPPRPTTWLDLLFIGYLAGTLALITGGVVGISGATTLGISPYAGLSADAINVQVIGTAQRALIKQFFGGGLPGALARQAAFEVPAGLTQGAIEAYAELAIRVVAGGGPRPPEAS